MATVDLNKEKTYIRQSALTRKTKTTLDPAKFDDFPKFSSCRKILIEMDHLHEQKAKRPPEHEKIQSSKKISEVQRFIYARKRKNKERGKRGVLLSQERGAQTMKDVSFQTKDPI